MTLQLCNSIVAGFTLQLALYNTFGSRAVRSSCVLNTLRLIAGDALSNPSVIV